MLFRNLAVRLSADVTGYVAPVRAAKAETDSFARSVSRAAAQGDADWRRLGRGMVVAGGVILLAMGALVSKAVEFEAAMRDVNSIQKQSEDQFRATSDAVIDMSTRVPQSATTLARGLYEIASSGFQGADALNLLEQSSIAATAGMTDTDTAARGIVASLNAYGDSAGEAQDRADIMFKTVELGVLRFEELSASIGDWVGSASAAGVGFDEANAAIAAMTLSGIDASKAGISLNRVLQALIDPSDSMAAALHDLGYESGIAALDALGLQGTMELLRTATGGNIEALVDLFPEIRGARGALALMANEGQNYARVAGEITDETARAGAAQDAYEEQSKSLRVQLQLAGSSLNALAIDMGNALIPAIRPVVKLTGMMADGFRSLPGPVKTATSVGIAAAGMLLALGGAAILLGPAVAQVTTMFGWATTAVTTHTIAASGLIAQYGAVRGATMALAGVILNPWTLLALGTVAIGAAVRGVQGWRNEARATVNELTADADLSSLESIEAQYQDLARMLNDTQAQRRAQSGWEGFTSSLADVLIPMHDVEDSGGDLSGMAQELGVEVEDLERRWESMWVRSSQVANMALHDLDPTLLAEFGENSIEQVEGISEAIRELAASEGIDLGAKMGTEELQQTEQALLDLFMASQTGTVGTQQIIDALGQVASPASTAADELGAYEDALDAVVSTTLQAFDAQTSFQDSLGSLADAVAENGRTFSVSTEEGRANRDAISAAAQAALDHAQAVAEETGSIEAGNQVLGRHVFQLAATMQQAGFTNDEIDRMIRTMGLTPRRLATLVALEGSGTAEAALDRILGRQRRARRPVNSEVSLSGDEVVTARLDAMNARARDFARPRNRADRETTLNANDRPARNTLDSITAEYRRRWQQWRPQAQLDADARMAANTHARTVAFLRREWDGVSFSANLVLRTTGDGYGMINNPTPLMSPSGGTVDEIIGHAARMLPAGSYNVTSTYRPGAITATGNPSYHASGRAVDFTGDMPAIFGAFRPYASMLKELIWSPAGGNQIWNGSPHFYGEPTRGDHWDHVHVAMARGAVFDRDTTIKYARFAETPGARPEIVTPQRLMAATFRRELASHGGHGGGGVYQFSFPNYVGSREELVATLTAALDTPGAQAAIARTAQAAVGA